MGFVPQQKSNNARGDAISRIVSDIVSCGNQIHQFFHNQKIGSLLKRSNIGKEKGVSPVAVFRVLITLVFTRKNLFRTLEAGGSCGRAKDTVYRFLNSAQLVMESLQKGLAAKRPLTGLIHHSDRGSQYCALELCVIA